MATCDICKITVDRGDDQKIKCNDCQCIFHSVCANLSKDDLDFIRERKQVWVCSACVKKRRTNKCNSPLITVPQSLSSSLMQSTDIYNELVAFKNEFTSQFIALNERLSLLESNLCDKVSALVKENELLKSDVYNLNIRLSNIEQASLANSIDIVGIQTNNGDCLTSTVTNFLKSSLNLSISENDIDVVYKRKPKQSTSTSVIYVKFARKITKERVFAAKKRLKDHATAQLGSTSNRKIFINHSLSSKKRAIFSTAWKLKKLGKCYRIWLSNGNICIKTKEDGEVLIINSLCDLEFLQHL